MSDRIAIMREGRFEQMGTPSQVYDSPKTAYVARFVGRPTLSRARRELSRGTWWSLWARGESLLRQPRIPVCPRCPGALAVRGEQAQAVKGEDGPACLGW